MSLQQKKDLIWMLCFNNYRTDDNKKFVKTVGKHIARSIEFLEGDNIIMKYANTESGFKEKRELKLEDVFNWIS